jgi:hypothetical protein
MDCSSLSLMALTIYPDLTETIQHGYILLQTRKCHDRRSKKYPHLYVAESQFRYNSRFNDNIFENGDERMLKASKADIVLGALLTTIFWIAILGWQASYSPTERQKDECYEAAKRTGHKADDCKTFWEKTTSDPIALFNLILAFSTVGLWVATFSLSRAGNNQIKLARQEFIATHRPKIRVHAVEITRKVYGDDDTTYIGASLLCFNEGESVAKNVEVRGEVFMGPNFAIDVQRRLVKTFGEVISGQKMRAEITSTHSVVNAAAGERTGIIFYCIGWIAYWDESGQRRETGFCFKPEFGIEGDRWISAGKPQYEYSY